MGLLVWRCRCVVVFGLVVLCLGLVGGLLLLRLPVLLGIRGLRLLCRTRLVRFGRLVVPTGLRLLGGRIFVVLVRFRFGLLLFLLLRVRLVVLVIVSGFRLVVCAAVFVGRLCRSLSCRLPWLPVLP